MCRKSFTGVLWHLQCHNKANLLHKSKQADGVTKCEATLGLETHRLPSCTALLSTQSPRLYRPACFELDVAGLLSKAPTRLLSTALAAEQHGCRGYKACSQGWQRPRLSQTCCVLRWCGDSALQCQVHDESCTPVWHVCESECA